MNFWPVGPDVTGNKLGFFIGPLYQGFALRWGNRRPFGAHIRRHGRGTEARYMNLAIVNDFLAAHAGSGTPARTKTYLPAMASARMRAVLSRMIRGSTGRPSIRALRTSLPEMKTGFSSVWFSIRSTRLIDW